MHVEQLHRKYDCIGSAATDGLQEIRLFNALSCRSLGFAGAWKAHPAFDAIHSRASFDKLIDAAKLDLPVMAAVV